MTQAYIFLYHLHDDPLIRHATILIVDDEVEFTHKPEYCRIIIRPCSHNILKHLHTRDPYLV